MEIISISVKFSFEGYDPNYIATTKLRKSGTELDFDVLVFPENPYNIFYRGPDYNCGETGFYRSGFTHVIQKRRY
jgi:hypothetical protein